MLSAHGSKKAVSIGRSRVFRHSGKARSGNSWAYGFYWSGRLRPDLRVCGSDPVLPHALVVLRTQGRRKFVPGHWALGLVILDNRPSQGRTASHPLSAGHPCS